MRFELDEPPIGAARPRFRHLGGGRIMTYDPQARDKQRITADLQRQYACQKTRDLAYNEAYEVSCTFLFPIAQSCSQGAANAKLWGLEPCITKPDLDNAAKLVLDCFNGWLFDDKQIISLNCKKQFANKQKIVIDIMTKKRLNLSEKVTGILEQMGPDMLFDMLKDVKGLYETYDVDENSDWIADCVGDDEARAVRLARTAYLLSKVASRYGRTLGRIQKNFPDFWREAEAIAQETQNDGASVASADGARELADDIGGDATAS